MATISTREEALTSFTESYRWLIAQQGQGVHTPLPRQLKQTIKLYFRKEGVDAIAQVERDALNAKGVTPALAKRTPEAPKKGSSDRRLERIAMKEIGLEEGSNTKARISRMQRLASRGQLETQMSRTGSEAKENVAGGSRAMESVAIENNSNVKRAKRSAESKKEEYFVTENPDAFSTAPKSDDIYNDRVPDNDVDLGRTVAQMLEPHFNVLNTAEIQLIKDMGAKEIVDKFGKERIEATLIAFEDPDLSLAGSAKQLANRLKFRIYPDSK